jgi:hypothetical protein
MATASSIIRVSIVGDADKLTAALGQAEGKVKGIATKIGAAFIALQVGREVVDFGDESVKQFDRLTDATTRLENQLGGLSAGLVDTADDFSKLGLSAQDVLEMEARFADLGTAIGLSDNAIASTAENVAATAAAFSLLTDKNPDTVLDLISKAAGGSAKAAKELGVTLDDSLNPAQQLTSILEQLAPALADVTTGSSDLEQKQKELGARIETLQAQLGEKLAPALETVLQFILDEIDAIPAAIAGFEMLGKAGEDFARAVLGPFGNVRDVLADIVGLLGSAIGQLDQHGTSYLSENQARNAQENWERRNQGAR